MDTWSVLETDFLAPPVVWAASAALENVAGLAVRAWGGYAQACTAKFYHMTASAYQEAQRDLTLPHTLISVPLRTCCPVCTIHGKHRCAQAERCRMILGRDELIPPATAEEDSAAAVPPEVAERVAAVELQGNFMFDPVRISCATCCCGTHDLPSYGAD